MLTVAEIRQKYIEFFIEKQHAHVPSSPVVPPDDPTMLFCSAGMVQFKALYSGTVALPYVRATTVQKCLRAGGKGSDLENVGKTLRHFTFFEMLGNFSFGDYFKQEAIHWAWEFLTEPRWLGMPAERLWPTIFGKPKDKANPQGAWEIDEEARGFWGETGNVNPVTMLNEKENFWGPAGETGACGPCSEIKFFTGTEEQLKEYQRLAASAKFEDQEKVRHDIVELGDLFLEIWNLVFPQFDQQPDGSRPLLKNRGIDTGAGLERMSTAVQFLQSGGAINSPYETDLLRPMVNAISAVAGLPYPTLAGDGTAAQALRDAGYKVEDVRLAMNACVDHARALTFTLAEGVVPSNEGRGYVMRRILRRAARFGKKIGIADPFLYRLVPAIAQAMGDAYPELAQRVEYIQKIVRGEEERFSRTLNQGSELLEQILAGMTAGETLSGDEAYRLYDTHGFPLDLTIEAAEERGVQVDEAGYAKAQEKAKATARASWKGGAGTGVWVELLKGLEGKTEFTGYDATESPAKVLALIVDGKRVEKAQEGQPAIAVLDRTPFYAESGGQIGDRGSFAAEDGATIFTVEDTQKTGDGFFLHYGQAEAPLTVGQSVLACVEASRRRDLMANHSSVHLMQAGLKKFVGDHVTQQGSWVGPEGMRFDFTNPEALGEAVLRQIEKYVNEQIRASMPVTIKEMDMEEAKATGAIATFGEKYGARVRVVAMGDGEAPVSVEFCGGTHVGNTGHLGVFVITSESSVASGIRRIEGKAGRAALEHIARERSVVQELARTLAVKPDAVVDRVGALQDEVKALRRQLDEVKSAQARAQMAKAAETAQEIDGVKLVIQRIDGADANALGKAWDALRAKSAASTLGVFCGVAEGKVNLVVGATEDIAPARIKAGEVLQLIAAELGGKGGGKPTLARGSGTDVERLASVLAELPKVVRGMLKLDEL